MSAFTNQMKAFLDFCHPHRINHVVICRGYNDPSKFHASVTLFDRPNFPHVRSVGEYDDPSVAVWDLRRVLVSVYDTPVLSQTYPDM